MTSRKQITYSIVLHLLLFANTKQIVILVLYVLCEPLLLSILGENHLRRYVGHQLRGEFDVGDASPELLARLYLQRPGRQLQGLARHDRTQRMDGARQCPGNNLP